MEYKMSGYASDLVAAAEELKSSVSREVVGGKWSDSVGQSYDSYSGRMLDRAYSIQQVCREIDNIANSLDDFNVTADTAAVNSLERQVAAR